MPPWSLLVSGRRYGTVAEERSTILLNTGRPDT